MELNPFEIIRKIYLKEELDCESNVQLNIFEKKNNNAKRNI